MRRERSVRHPQKQKRGVPSAERGDWIYGRRPVMEVVKAGKRHLYEALLPPPGRDAPEIAELRTLLQTQGVPFRAAERVELDERCAGGNHQGVALRTGGFPYISFDQVVHDVKANADAVVLFLDHIEDPQNVGSLLRTADATGVTAVVLPEDRAVGVTPAAVRASAGAEHLRVAKVVNLVRHAGTERGLTTGLDAPQVSPTPRSISRDGRGRSRQ